MYIRIWIYSSKHYSPLLPSVVSTPWSWELKLCVILCSVVMFLIRVTNSIIYTVPVCSLMTASMTLNLGLLFLLDNNTLIGMTTWKVVNYGRWEISLFLCISLYLLLIFQHTMLTEIEPWLYCKSTPHGSFISKWSNNYPLYAILPLHDDTYSWGSIMGLHKLFTHECHVL